MSVPKPLPFPRGFVLSNSALRPPQGYIRGPILLNFYVHPSNNIEASGTDDLFVISIGHLVPTAPRTSEPPTQILLNALRVGEAEFLKILSTFSGRHAVLFGSKGNVRVVNDAASLRSVFYASDGGVIASHPLLVENVLGGSIQKDDMPFRYGYPGNRTPYARTKILTPNTYYWLSAHVVRRFWPLLPLAREMTTVAAKKMLEESSYALKSIARGRAVKLTLTAGLDSRTVFALALHAGIKFTTYTYGNDRATKVDRDIARDLSVQFGIPHTIIPRRVPDAALETSVVESLYKPLHHGPWIKALQEHYEDQETLAVLGNLLEIGRSNSSNERRQGVDPPVSAQTMAALHFIRMGKARQDDIEKWGLEKFHSLSEKAFEGFIHDTGYASQVGILDPFDQFYWEHRMATWQGPAMGERDYYGLPFIPFNSRNIFETMLGVSKEKRHADETVYEMLRIVDPSLLDLPINPKTWP